VGEFGDKFRKAREKKGISLDDVSNVTKISSRNLQAIEEEHFDQLPGGVFNKGFIRAYARHVGLDAEQAVNEYLACLRQAQIDAQAVWEPEDRAAVVENRPLVTDPSKKSPGKSGNSRKETPLQVEELPDLQLPKAKDVRSPRRDYVQSRERLVSWKFVVGTALFVIAGIALWQRHVRGARAEGEAVPRLVAEHAVSTPSVEISPPTQGPALPKAVSSAALKQQAPTGPAQSASSSPTIVTAPKPATTEKAAVEKDDDVTATPPPDATPTAPATALANFTLVIRASENSWVSVTADGQLVTQETLIAPAHTTVRANREIVAKIGNAAGVSFSWNGQDIPSDGTESEVRTYLFDASGMRVLPPLVPSMQNR